MARIEAKDVGLDTVSPKPGTRKDPVKILGNGDLSKKLTVRAHAFSATAREKIEAAGGTAETID